MFQEVCLANVLRIKATVFVVLYFSFNGISIWVKVRDHVYEWQIFFSPINSIGFLIFVLTLEISDNRISETNKVYQEILPRDVIEMFYFGVGSEAKIIFITGNKNPFLKSPAKSLVSGWNLSKEIV